MLLAASAGGSGPSFRRLPVARCLTQRSPQAGDRRLGPLKPSSDRQVPVRGRRNKLPVHGEAVIVVDEFTADAPACTNDRNLACHSSQGASPPGIASAGLYQGLRRTHQTGELQRCDTTEHQVDWSNRSTGKLRGEQGLNLGMDIVLLLVRRVGTQNERNVFSRFELSCPRSDQRVPAILQAP